MAAAPAGAAVWELSQIETPKNHSSPVSAQTPVAYLPTDDNSTE